MRVGVFVRVFVAVFVGVLERVGVGVLVEVFVCVGVCVLVGVGVTVGVFVASVRRPKFTFWQGGSVTVFFLGVVLINPCGSVNNTLRLPAPRFLKIYFPFAFVFVVFNSLPVAMSLTLTLTPAMPGSPLSRLPFKFESRNTTPLMLVVQAASATLLFG